MLLHDSLDVAAGQGVKSKWKKAVQESIWILRHHVTQKREAGKETVDAGVTHYVIAAVLLQNIDKSFSRDGHQTSVQNGKLLLHKGGALILDLADHDVDDRSTLDHKADLDTMPPADHCLCQTRIV